MNQVANNLTQLPRKRGRPTKYNKAYGDKLANELPQYLTGKDNLEDICVRLGFTKATFYKLCSLSTDLNDAYQQRVKSKGGRPNIFTKEYANHIADDLPQMFVRGESLAQVLKKLELSKDSFHKLLALSPRFTAAYAQGLINSEAWWTETGQMGAVGKIKLNSAAWIFNMRNRFKWSDRIEIIGSLEVSNKTEVTRTVVYPKQITNDEG